MPFNPRDFLDAARCINLRQPVPGESRYRSTMGRAYYSAFLAVREAIRRRFSHQHDYHPGHFQLAEALLRHANADVRRLGAPLNTLRSNRAHADYKLNDAFVEDQADESIVDAERVLVILATVEGMLPDLPNVRPTV
jgi:uncharacterized protein (UPF0332 family)